MGEKKIQIDFGCKKIVPYWSRNALKISPKILWFEIIKIKWSCYSPEMAQMKNYECVIVSM